MEIRADNLSSLVCLGSFCGGDELTSLKGKRLLTILSYAYIEYVQGTIVGGGVRRRKRLP